jgi:hypothetical protein
MNIEHPTSNIQHRTSLETTSRETAGLSDDTVLRERPQPHEHQYKVRIGHTEMTVSGRDPADAVRNARRRLAGELPRLWDVIYRMSEEEFRVEEVR